MIAADVWVDLVVGRDTHTGTEANPLATVEAGLALAEAGEVVGVRGYQAARFYRESGLASVAAGVTIRGYGELPPVLYGLTTAPAAVLDSGSVYGIDAATNPGNAVFTLAGSGLMVMGNAVANKAALAADYDVFWEDATDKFWFRLSTNPATTLASIEFCGTENALTIAHDDFTLDGFEIRGHYGGFIIDGADRAALLNSRLEFASDDLSGGVDFLDAWVENCDFGACGRKLAALALEAYGDQWSGHTTGANLCTYTIRRSRFRDAKKAAIDSIGKSSGVVEDCEIVGCGGNIFAAQDAGHVLTVRNSKVVMGATDIGALGVVTGDVNLYNSTLIGPSVAAGYLITTLGGTLTAKNVIGVRALVGLLNLGGTVTERKNSFGGCATPSNGALDASDVAGDPLLVDVANLDDRILESSPCRRTGDDLTSTGFTGDRIGRPRPASSWDIGSRQFAVPSTWAGRRRTRPR